MGWILLILAVGSAFWLIIRPPQAGTGKLRAFIYWCLFLVCAYYTAGYIYSERAYTTSAIAAILMLVLALAVTFRGMKRKGFKVKSKITVLIHPEVRYMYVYDVTGALHEFSSAEAAEPKMIQFEEARREHISKHIAGLIGNQRKYAILFEKDRIKKDKQNQRKAYKDFDKFIKLDGMAELYRQYHELRTMAESGDADAQYAFYMFITDNGESITSRMAKADLLNWNHYTDFGRLFGNLTGMPISSDYWLEKAAKQGHLEAAATLKKLKETRDTEDNPLYFKDYLQVYRTKKRPKSSLDELDGLLAEAEGGDPDDQYKCAMYLHENRNDLAGDPRFKNLAPSKELAAIVIEQIAGDLLYEAWEQDHKDAAQAIFLLDESVIEDIVNRQIVWLKILEDRKRYAYLSSSGGPYPEFDMSGALNRMGSYAKSMDGAGVRSPYAAQIIYGDDVQVVYDSDGKISKYVSKQSSSEAAKIIYGEDVTVVHDANGKIDKHIP